MKSAILPCSHMGWGGVGGEKLIGLALHRKSDSWMKTTSKGNTSKGPELYLEPSRGRFVHDMTGKKNCMVQLYLGQQIYDMHALKGNKVK